MEFISNAFLNTILRITNAQLKPYQRWEDVRLIEIDGQTEEELQKFHVEVNYSLPKFCELLDIIVDSNVECYGGNFIDDTFYAMKFHGCIKEIKSQLRGCKRILESDICKRNVLIREGLDLEVKILERTLCLKPVEYVASYIHFLLTNCNDYFVLHKWDKYVFISELLNELGLYYREPFLTLEEANDLVDRKLRDDPDFNQISGRQMIADRMKKYIEKRFAPVLMIFR